MSRLRNKRILPLGVAAAILLASSPSHADQEAELLRAKADYVVAIEFEKRAAEELTQTEEVANSLESRIAQSSTAELVKIADIEKRKAAAERELLALLGRLAEIEFSVARARDLAAEARKAYNQALPIYEIIGRSQQLADYPEWKAIEGRASQTAQDARKAAEDAAPRLKSVNDEIDAKRRQILAIQDEFGQPLGGPDNTLMRSWLEAGIATARARRKHGETVHELTGAFDRYMAKLEPARPPFLEAVYVDVGAARIYSGIWRPKRDQDGDAAVRVSDLRAIRDELVGTIIEREREAETLRIKRLELAESMHAKALRYVDAEARLADARWKKIAFTALAEVAGTIAEAALTGGAATAMRKAAEISEEKIAEAAAKKLLQNPPPLLGEAEEVAARLARQSEEAFARNVRTAYAEAERLATEAAARRVRRTGEAIDVAAVDAKRQLDRALRGLNDSDPVLRAEAQREAIRLLGEKAFIVLEPVLQALGGKPGSNALADFYHSAGGSGDPVERLAAKNAQAGYSNATADVKSVVYGDMYEQGIARSISYTISVAPDAARAGVAAMRKAAADNVANWRQVASGGKAFLRGGFKWTNLKEAAWGSARGNVIGLVTTSAKAVITSYYGSQEQAAGMIAYELYAQLTFDQKILNKMRESGVVLDLDLREARRIYAELQTYLTLLGTPRELDVRDDVQSMDAAGDLKLQLRFSAPLDRAPQVSLAGVALVLQAESKDAQGGAAVWSVTVPRSQLPADAIAADLVVDLVAGTRPFDRLDANPATPGRPDPRAQPSAVAAELKWLDLDIGGDRNHKIALRDPWSGIWSRGETRIRVSRDRLSLTGVIETPSAVSRGERGYAVGQKVMQGDIGTDRTAQLEWLARYDRSWREKCPAKANGYWSRGTYKLDPGGTLSGSWQNQELDEACVIAATTEAQDTLKREAGR